MLNVHKEHRFWLTLTGSVCIKEVCKEENSTCTFTKPCLKMRLTTLFSIEEKVHGYILGGKHVYLK